MISENNPITEEKVLVRFYRYSNIENGSGDAGTVMYARVPLDNFRREDMKTFDGEPYYIYFLEKVGNIEKALGKYWGITTGYDRGDLDRMEKELEAAKKQVEILSTIEEF